MQVDWLQDADFFIIRHARSAGQDDITAYFKGNMRVPLSVPEGRMQAEELGDFLKDHFDRDAPKGNVAIYSSDMLRSKGTALISKRRVPIIANTITHLSHDLREMSLGVAEGYTSDEIRKLFPDFRDARDAGKHDGTRHVVQYPGVDADGRAGECHSMVHERTARLLPVFKEEYDKGARTFMVFTHGTTGRALQMNLTGVPSSDKAWANWPTPFNTQVDLIRAGVQECIYLGAASPESLLRQAGRARNPGRHIR